MSDTDETADQIESFVSDHLSNVTSFSRRSKVIHETLWGTNLYKPHEIALLDTALFQRLRSIHQTGFSYFTYPTALHTRFDHSIGVLTLCSRFVEAVAKKHIDGLLRYRLRAPKLIGS